MVGPSVALRPQDILMCSVQRKTYETKVIVIKLLLTILLQRIYMDSIDSVQ